MAQPDHETEWAFIEAERWQARLGSGEVTRRDLAEFERWLAGSEVRRRAFAEVRALWRAMDGLGERVLDGTAGGHAANNNNNNAVSAMPRPRSRPRASTPQWIGRRWMAVAAAVAFLVLAGGAYQLWFTGQAYRTAAGEMRAIALEDGSTIQLNTRSLVEVDFDRRERHISLEEGEIFVDAAADKSRPLVVQAGDLSVRVVGTEFNVYRAPTATIVTVVDGQVDVVVPARGNGDVEYRRLAPGQQVRYDAAGGLGQPVEVSPEVVTAWRERMLIYEGVSFALVIDDINRYLDRRVVIVDPELNDLEVSGVFYLRNQKSILTMLERALPIRIVNRSRDVTLVFSAE